MVFGRTDLRISVSEAKFDGEADFEVRSAVAPQKTRQISKNRNFRSEFFAEKKKSASKNETLRIAGNAFSQNLAAVQAMFEG